MSVVIISVIVLPARNVAEAVTRPKGVAQRPEHMQGIWAIIMVCHRKMAELLYQGDLGRAEPNQFVEHVRLQGLDTQYFV